jgi:hypothetical protein
MGEAKYVYKVLLGRNGDAAPLCFCGKEVAEFVGKCVRCYGAESSKNAPKYAPSNTGQQANFTS